MNKCKPENPGTDLISTTEAEVMIHTIRFVYILQNSLLNLKMCHWLINVSKNMTKIVTVKYLNDQNRALKNSTSLCEGDTPSFSEQILSDTPL